VPEASGLSVVTGNDSARTAYERVAFVANGQLQPVSPDEPDRVEERMLVALTA
jgi:hypothetical protein